MRDQITLGSVGVFSLLVCVCLEPPLISANPFLAAGKAGNSAPVPLLSAQPLRPEFWTAIQSLATHLATDPPIAGAVKHPWLGIVPLAGQEHPDTEIQNALIYLDQALQQAANGQDLLRQMTDIEGLPSAKKQEQLLGKLDPVREKAAQEASKAVQTALSPYLSLGPDQSPNETGLSQLELIYQLLTRLQALGIYNGYATSFHIYASAAKVGSLMHRVKAQLKGLGGQGNGSLPAAAVNATPATRSHSPERLGLRRPGQNLRESGIIAESPALRTILGQTVPKLVLSDDTVLILGETGTGKDVVARALHEATQEHRQRQAGGRKTTVPFENVTVPNLPAELVENELFGHQKGAYTNAHKDTLGTFDRAQGGTLVLGEIGDMLPGLQAKLLQVLQDGTYRRVGGAEVLTFQGRVIATTNKDLERLIAQGLFRQDLYQRLGNVVIKIPPLRQRLQDIPPLVQLALERSNGKYGQDKALLPEAMDLLLRYPWPGNVRELENAINRAHLSSQGTFIEINDLPEEIRNTAHLGPANGRLPESPTESLWKGQERIEREETFRALIQHGYNREETAAALGISRVTLYRKMKKYDLFQEPVPDPSPQSIEPPNGTLESAVGTEEKRRIIAALQRHQYNRKETAKDLGISRVTLYKKMHKHNLIHTRLHQQQ